MKPDIKYSSEISSVKMQILGEFRMQIFGPGSECAPWRERETRASGPDPRVACPLFHGRVRNSGGPSVTRRYPWLTTSIDALRRVLKVHFTLPSLWVQLLVQGQQGVTFSCNEKWHETKVGWILNGILFYPKNPANSEP